MASEFAEISTVNGINKLNTQVSTIQSSTAAGQMAQASDLVGKQVAVSGDTLTPNAAGSRDRRVQPEQCGTECARHGAQSERQRGRHRQSRRAAGRAAEFHLE